MKIAILSDIHGNIYALKEVIKQMQKQNIELVFCLGDFLGYYYDAIEVFDEIEKWKHHSISGNHERILMSFLNGTDEYKEKITKKYGDSYLKYEKVFTKELIEKIVDLPMEKRVTIDGYRFLLCHGSPLDKDQYIYPDENRETLDACSLAGFDFIFMGHTHYPMIYKSTNTTLINVGSVGQSRTIGGIANWGIFNTNNGVYIAQNTPYDVEVIEKSLSGNEKQYLYKILRRNNAV